MGILRASGDPRYEGRGTATAAKLFISPNAASTIVKYVNYVYLLLFLRIFDGDGISQQ